MIYAAETKRARLEWVLRDLERARRMQLNGVLDYSGMPIEHEINRLENDAAWCRSRKTRKPCACSFCAGCGR